MERRGIICAGVTCIDVNNIIEEWPQEEQISFIRESIPAPGGPAHNAPAGLVKLGAPFPVSMICVVGDDAYGDIFLRKAAGYGLDVSGVVRVKGANTDYTHVMTSAKTGRRTFFCHTGANSTMTGALLAPKTTREKIYYIGSPGLSLPIDEQDGWRFALRKARDMGFKTCMELCPVPPNNQRTYVRPCLPLLDYFVVNDSEAEIVSGLPVLREGKWDWQLAETAAHKLLEMGVSELAAIHHPMGAIAVTRSGEVAKAASVKVEQSEIVSAVGAGDAFYAGMLLGLHEDWPLADCVALANAAAATSLQSPTTSASIRPWRDCLAYAAEKGLRPL